MAYIIYFSMDSNLLIWLLCNFEKSYILIERGIKMKPIIINPNLDLCFDEDNNVWYFTKWNSLGELELGSINYETKSKAMHAYMIGNIEWIADVDEV